jgi:hypothetical protein
MPATSAAIPLGRTVPRWLAPSLVDVLFVVLLLAVFVRPGGWQALLADGDTGWHVRTGELVLATGQAPRSDPFSFTRPGQTWYAWEWLSDTGFAIAWRHGELTAVAKMAGAVLCLAAALLFWRLLRRGAGLWIALGVTLAAVSASSVHYLARPHVFSILFYTASLWVLDEARLRPRLIRVLPPLAALWANLHAGFVALPATLVFAAAVDAWRRDFSGARRHGAAAVACLLASGLNPYGFELHRHILAYLDAPWILNQVQEFQSPSIRSEGMVVFAVLLLVSVALASKTVARGEWFEGGLVLAWSFAALRSARHIPFFAIAAAPVVAGECARLWRTAAGSAPPHAPLRVFWETGCDLGSRPRATFWLPLFGAAALAASPAVEFPAARFPVQAVERNLGLLADSSFNPRVLASDQWSDYLIYRLYPARRVFFDGRSDFYGPAVAADYRTVMTAAPGWREVLARYRFDLALLPRDCPLNAALEREPGWHKFYEDSVACLYRREGEISR